MLPPSQYETSDVYLAAFLLCMGAKFLGFSRPSKRRVLFQFRSDEQLHELLRLYWKNGEVSLIPARLFGSLRRLKGIVREAAAVTSPDASSSSAAVPSGDHVGR